MNNEIVVIPLRVNKTKNGKSILSYALKENESSYSKGLSVLSHWTDDEKLFENMSIDDMAKPCRATYEYEQTYNGLARIKLITLVTKEGKDLLA